MSRAIACTVFTLAYSWRIFIVLVVHFIVVLLLKLMFEKRTDGPKAIRKCDPFMKYLRPYFYVVLGAFTSTFVYFRIQRPLADQNELSQRHSTFIIQV